MPPASQTEHRVVSNTALPYISNASLTSTDPHFISGSQNVMTSIRNWSERFPGFSAPAIPGNFQNVQRQFWWRRWVSSTPNGGAFIAMVCDIQGGVATVWKYQVGLDAIAQLIWTSTSAEPFDFIISNNTCYFGNGTDMMQFDSNRIVTWGGAGPSVGPTLTLIAGASNVFTSWCYCSTYFDPVNDHETSPSAISACSGVFTNKSVKIGLVSSPNSRFTQMRVYRTPDGGAQDPSLMQEIAGSPFSTPTISTAFTVTDSTPDASLSIRVAPEFLRNDPPTPCKGFIDYSGRLWGFADNTVFYSGFEEIANGVPEECWPSGLNGNFYPYSDEVFALASLNDGIAIFQAEEIDKVEGDSLDTFRRYQLLQRRGTLNRACVAAVGGTVAWFDTSNTIWISDVGEISIPIRPDLVAINPMTGFMDIHISGIFHWLTFLDGGNGVLYVYDLDRNVWMPPKILGTTASGLFSGQTSLGVIDLMLALGNKTSLKLVAGTYNNGGTNYSSTLSTNLARMTPDENPSFQGTHDWSEIKTDTVPPTQVLQLTDDDPTQAPYTDITANGEPSPLLANQGKYLQSWRYPATPTSAAFMSMKFQWAANGQNFHLYQIDDAFHAAGE